MAFRGTIPDFQLANPIYTAAQVRFFTVTDQGVSTGVLATLYAAPTGTQTVGNPQTLDSEGKFTAPIYIDGPVIAEVVGPNVGSHVTGPIAPRGRWRGYYVTATRYFCEDFVRDPNDDAIYVATQDFTSTNLVADLVANLEVAIIQTGNIPFVTTVASGVHQGTWFTENAVYDVGTNKWNRVDDTKPALAINFRASVNLPNEVVKGVAMWRCVAGANPISDTYDTSGGWQALQKWTDTGGLVMGGKGFKMEGDGSSPFGRFVHTVDGANVYTGICTNFISDFNTNAGDTAGSPSWFIGRKNDSFIVGRIAAGGGFDPASLTLLVNISGAGLVAGVLEPQGRVSGIVTQSDSFVFSAATHRGKIVESTKATAMTATVNASTFAAEDVVQITQAGAGQLSIAAGGGMTIRSADGYLKLRTQWSMATLYFRSPTEAVLGGDIRA